MLNNKSPANLSIKIIILSILAATIITQTQKSQWSSFLFLITFSTAIIILFLYTSTSTTNEKQKKNTNISIVATIVLINLYTEKRNTPTILQPKKFSSSIIPTILIVILIAAIVSITFFASNPLSPVQTRF